MKDFYRRMRGKANEVWIPLFVVLIVSTIAFVLPRPDDSADGLARAQSLESTNAVFLPRVLRGGGGLTIEASDQLGGTTRALVGFGDRVFAGIDDRLTVFDVSEPTDPQPLSSLPGLGANIEAMVMDELLYVAAG